MDAIHYIQTHNLIGLKAGSNRTDFLEIWMVVVDKRIFARSWGLAERSWYNTFLNNPSGEIQCGDAVYRITAKVPDDLHHLTEPINQAYLNKYNEGRNAPYAQGIIQPQHAARTMEFVIQEKLA